MEDIPITPMRYPSTTEIAIASGGVGALQSYLIFGPGGSLNNSPVNRFVVEGLYNFIGSEAASYATPRLLPYVPMVDSGNPSETDPTKNGTVPNNLIQILIPPTVGGLTTTALLSVLNGERSRWEMGRNFLLSFISQTAGYYVVDFYKNQNIW